MVELIVKIIGKGIPVFGAVRYRKGEYVLVADVSKLKKLIKWKPKFSSEKGIGNTIKFYEKNSKDLVSIIMNCHNGEDFRRVSHKYKKTNI